MRARKNRRRFPDDIFKCIFLNEKVKISIKISLKFVFKGPINNDPPMMQIMAWRRPGDKPLSEPTMVILLTHICVTWPLCAHIYFHIISLLWVRFYSILIYCSLVQFVQLVMLPINQAVNILLSFIMLSTGTNLCSAHKCLIIACRSNIPHGTHCSIPRESTVHASKSWRFLAYHIPNIDLTTRIVFRSKWRICPFL